MTSGVHAVRKKTPMRRPILGLLFLAAILIFGYYIGAAQEKLHPSLKALNGLTPENHSDSGSRLKAHTMYPLGFSKGGSFAYLGLQVSPDGGNSPYFRIVSLISDRLLYLETFEPADGEDGSRMRSLAQSRGAHISALLDRFNIEPFRSAGLQRFPFEYRGDILDAVIRRKPLEGKTAEECGGRNPEEIEILLTSENRGEKVIAGYDGCASNTPFIEAIEGFIKNPLEERIVVLASGTQHVAGDTMEAKFYPVGAHLTSGFVRP